MTYLGARTRPIESEAKQWFSIFPIRAAASAVPADDAALGDGAPISEAPSTRDSGQRGALGTEPVHADTMPP